MTATSPPEHRRIRLRAPLDLRLTLSPLRHGPADPTVRITAQDAWRAGHTPDGPATVHVIHEGAEVRVEAWGPGAAWALESAPALIGEDDDPSGFSPTEPIVRELHRRHPGLRVGRSHGVVAALVATVFGQRVTAEEGHRTWSAFVRSHGSPAPGPAPGPVPLRVPPTPDAIAAIPYHAFHPLGVERSRADTIRGAMRVASRLDLRPDVDTAAAGRLLGQIRGIGPWTVGLVLGPALGDPDAVPIGDYHLPGIVAYALAGEEKADDARMLELLAPFTGHRGRVIRLIMTGGHGPPRRAPRQRIIPIAKM